MATTRTSTSGSRTREKFQCAECGVVSLKWVGRCGSCGTWNTLTPIETSRSTVNDYVRAEPVPITDVDPSGWELRSIGISEVDRVLGGGLVPGSVTLLGGEPGIGKSTLLLQVLAAVASAGSKVLYISAEESTAQVRLRASRLGALESTLWLASETSLPAIVSCIDSIKPDMLVVDSIQTVFDPDVGSTPGSVTQVRECAAQLVREAKDRGLTTMLVGHVTKEGNLAGPRVLEHMVDTVLTFEGDRHHALRLLRVTKHRFGATDNLGLFEMTDVGLSVVSDPSRLFLADRSPGVSGSIVIPTMEGHRPLLVEIQALVTQSALAIPRRSAQGLDSGRLAVLLAVLSKRANHDLAHSDVHALAVGGVRVVEPAADLALALAIASSHSEQPLPSDLVACGEVGLGGELRQVSQFERRLSEAARLGFTRAVIPVLAPEPPAGITPLRASNLAEAIALVCHDRGQSGEPWQSRPTIVA